MHAFLLLVLGTLASIAPPSTAHQLSHSNGQQTFSLQQHPSDADANAGSQKELVPVLKVAVIGGGAAGSSASYFLKHLISQHALQFGETGTIGAVEVTLHESSDYVGGRSSVAKPWNVQDDDESDGEEFVETGASIFAESNKNLIKAARVFNLSTSMLNGGVDDRMAIFDGETFLYSGSKSCGWICSIRMLWRYGRSPMRVQSLVTSVVDSFSSIYTSSFLRLGPFDSVHHFAAASHLSATSSTLASDYFDKAQVADAFTREIIGSATRVNYGQDVDTMHSLASLVSLAANGARSVVGGNRQIFEQFVEKSGARVALETKVTQIIKLDGELQHLWASSSSYASRWIVKCQSTSTGQTSSEIFDAVILAAPFHQSGIEIINSPASESIPIQDYVHLHVTFVTTNATSPSAPYFNTTSPVPTSIFSTFSTPSLHKPRFNSLNYLKRLLPSTAARLGLVGDAFVVKLFSAAELDDRFLTELFGGERNVARVMRKEWDAYPVMKPVQDANEFAKVRIDEGGLYYVNAFERLISTMETEVVASFNVVSLLLKDIFDFDVEKSWVEEDDE